MRGLSNTRNEFLLLYVLPRDEIQYLSTIFQGIHLELCPNINSSLAKSAATCVYTYNKMILEWLKGSLNEENWQKKQGTKKFVQLQLTWVPTSQLSTHNNTPPPVSHHVILYLDLPVWVPHMVSLPGVNSASPRVFHWHRSWKLVVIKP